MTIISRSFFVGQKMDWADAFFVNVYFENINSCLQNKLTFSNLTSISYFIVDFQLNPERTKYELDSIFF
jgi:hypothetical protein